MSGSRNVAIRDLAIGDNVHVRLAGFGDVKTGKIGGITVGRAQSPHMGEIYIATEIVMGAVDVRVDRDVFTWSLSEVSIILDVDNANAVPGRFYHHVLSEDEIKVSIHSVSRESSNSKAGADAAANAEGGVRTLPLFKFAVSTKASAAKTWNKSKDSQTDAEIKLSVPLVYHSGQIVFTAGGEAGDPRRPDTRDLRGPIVMPFRPKRADGSGGVRLDEDEVSTPLAQLEAVDATKPVTGRITVQARLENFVINCSRTAHRGEADLLISALSADKQAWFRRRKRAEEALRKRVTSLAAAKMSRPGDSNAAGVGEIDLFCCAFTFIPEPAPGLDA